MELDALNRRFAIDGAARFDLGEGNLPRLLISTPVAEAEIYVHGAHVTRFTPRVRPGVVAEKPVLWMSSKAVFAPGKAIRGGVPICFPWFGPRAGNPSAPAHGFARKMPWAVESVARAYSGEVSATFAITADEHTRSLWPCDFTARYTLTVNDKLSLALTITNTGPNTFGFEEALHTYLTIGDIHQVSVDGLGGVTYLDKMNNGEPTQQDMVPIRFIGETDRVYMRTHSNCRVDDPVLHRRIVIEKGGSESTVVWNPWIDKSRAMADFGDDEWPGMVCVETCNVGAQAVVLAPGASHTMTAILSTEAMGT